MSDIREKIKKLAETLDEEGYSPQDVILEFLDHGWIEASDLESAVRMLVPEVECKVEIKVNLLMKRGATADEVVELLAQEFDNSPLSVEEWFRSHLEDWDEV